MIYIHVRKRYGRNSEIETKKLRSVNKGQDDWRKFRAILLLPIFRPEESLKTAAQHFEGRRRERNFSVFAHVTMMLELTLVVAKMQKSHMQSSGIFIPEEGLLDYPSGTIRWRIMFFEYLIKNVASSFQVCACGISPSEKLSRVSLSLVSVHACNSTLTALIIWNEMDCLNRSCSADLVLCSSIQYVQ